MTQRIASAGDYHSIFHAFMQATGLKEGDSYNSLTYHKWLAFQGYLFDDLYRLSPDKPYNDELFKMFVDFCWYTPGKVPEIMGVHYGEL